LSQIHLHGTARASADRNTTLTLATVPADNG